MDEDEKTSTEQAEGLNQESTDTEDKTQDTDDNVESKDETESKPEEQSKTDEGDGWDDEWAEQYALPKTIRSVDELAKSYSSVLPEMKKLQTFKAQIEESLRRRGYESLEDAIAGTPEKKPETRPDKQEATTTGYFKRGRAAATAEKFFEYADVSDPKVAAAKSSWTTSAKMMDATVDGFASEVEDVLSGIAQAIQRERNLRIEGEWEHLDPAIKGQVSRKEVDRLLSTGDFHTVREAATAWLSSKHPDILTRIIKGAEESGRQRGLKQFGGKPPKKSDTLRRTGQTSGKSGSEYKKPDGSWDDDKIKKAIESRKLTSDDALKMVTA